MKDVGEIGVPNMLGYFYGGQVVQRVDREAHDFVVARLFLEHEDKTRWFYSFLDYFESRYPKAAKRKRVWKKWCNRCGKAVYGKNYLRGPKFYKAGTITVNGEEV